MVPFCHPKTIKFQKKIIPKMHQKKNDVCIEFLTILAPFWELSWGQISVKIGRRRGKQPYFLVRFFVFLTFSPSSPRGRGVPHRTAPILGGFWLHVGTILAPFLRPWVPSALDFGRLWCHVSTSFCKFWRPELNQTHVRNRGFSFSAFSIASLFYPPNEIRHSSA